MNILNVTTMRGLRGGDAQMYTIYKLLQSKKDLKQYILCPENSDLSKLCTHNNDPIITYKHNKYKAINCIKKLNESCKNNNIDVLHVHDSSALLYALIALKLSKRKPKLVLSRKRNNKIKSFFLNKIKYSHHYITKIVSVSKAVESIFDEIIINKDRLVTIYDAVDVKKISDKTNAKVLHKEFGLSEDTLLIANIAGLDNQKDLFTFIDTAKKIKNTSDNKLQIKYFIFGKGPQKEILQEYINNNQLQDDIILAGYRCDILDILPEINILLMTSIEEGLPLSIYEAFAAKVPVVSTDAGGIKEVVHTNLTGLISEIKDFKSLAKDCLLLLNDHALRTKIVENAFEIVSKHHDLKNFEENYYHFYKTL